jgi:hypothetical protein
MTKRLRVEAPRSTLDGRLPHVLHRQILAFAVDEDIGNLLCTSKTYRQEARQCLVEATCVHVTLATNPSAVLARNAMLACCRALKTLHLPAGFLFAQGNAVQWLTRCVV